MTAFLWAVVVLAGMFLSAALGDLVSEEIRGWLDKLPQAVLRLAAGRLDPAFRESIYQDEWLPELVYALRGDESRPITRLIRGTTFALGLLFAARRIARNRIPVSATPAAAGPVMAAAKEQFIHHFLVALANGEQADVSVVLSEPMDANAGDTLSGLAIAQALARRGYPAEPTTVTVVEVRRHPSREARPDPTR
jgi:hypothetical protein